jgi:glycine betaine/choline ABC-type transport system substrate-binding protein
LDRTKICGCLIFFVLLGACSHQQKIVVGSKNFTEQVLLGEIIAQRLENHIQGVRIERRLNLGGTLLAHQALIAKEIDLYPEYTGTAFTNILKRSGFKDARIVLEQVREAYSSGMAVEWLDPLGFNNTFAMAVRGADARTRHLVTLSDAAADPQGFVLGAGYEFLQRPDGYGMLNQAYLINWTAPTKSMDLGLVYTALTQHKVSMVAGSATDGMLSALDIKVLEDDKHAFPPYEACIAVRSDTLNANPALRGVLSALSGRFSTEKMQRLNFEVDGKHRAVRDVAREFLESAGLQ